MAISGPLKWHGGKAYLAGKIVALMPPHIHYVGEEAEEINARTGCVCCPLASRDRALDALIAMPRWSYLSPLKGIRTLYEEMRLPKHRLRKAGGARRKDGQLCTNQGRMGPLKLASRLEFLSRALSIQSDVNSAAARLKRPTVDYLDKEESARIIDLIEAETWPDGWDGTEPGADELLDEVRRDGSIQPALFRNTESY